MADDIFYERFPEELKGQAPRIWYEDGAYMVGINGKSWVGGDFGRVLMQYDDLAGAATNNIEARIRELAEDGIDKELAFPNAVLALFHYPDKKLRERVFRIYNEHMADLQERSNGHFYGVGLINWWDPKGTRSTLEELKSLGLKTFLLPLNPGKDDDGNIFDYGGATMDAVWDEIEEAGLPVTHHIGETPPKTPCEHNSVVVGMMINVDSFREQFAKYVFSGILDRHPKLRIGWFEGGIAWVPTALQDAEHLLASYRHMFNHQLEHDVRHYWDTHMSASFMVDPLGLQLIDRIGVDKVFWSSDYPHNESHVRLLGEVAGVGRRGGRAGERGQDRQRQHQEVPGHLDDHLRDGGYLRRSTFPTCRTRHACTAKAAPGCASAMKDKGVDALVLLGNGNVVYATGASWPLLDAGLSHVERPVALVLADDEHPHLYMPFREGAASESQIPADHVHRPLYLEFDEGVEHFAQRARRPGPRRRDRRGRRTHRRDAPRRGPAVPRRTAVGCRAGGRGRPSW